ncbi:MAG: sulfite exporter TauE/SafE family protein [Sphingobacteriales bacterium]|nr:MAG: sulfite exporter TauE/SafE family protein [Sphingobacteriales bacterium]
MLIKEQEAKLISLQAETVPQQNKWKKIAVTALIIGAVAAVTYAVIANNVAPATVDQYLEKLPAFFGEGFLWMLAVGFFAQLVDGALGMGYGVISATMLLMGGVSPAAVSGSIHTAEMFSSGASGFSHYKFGNVNKKLFKTLLIPGVIGSIAGACILGFYGDEYSKWMRPILSIYTLFLGVKILLNAFKKKTRPKRIKRAGWLAGAGGFLDSFGGGGWGPLVTSTLIAKGKTPKYVIGSVSLTEFFVTLASALTFFAILGVSHWQTIVGLIVGGMLAAPIAARLSGKLPIKKMFIGVAVIVIISSIRILWKSVELF